MSQDRRPARVRIVNAGLPDVGDSNLGGGPIGVAVVATPARSSGIGVIGWSLYYVGCAAGGAGAALAMRLL